MRKLIVSLLVLLLVFFAHMQATQAYWAESIETTQNEVTISITIGSWLFDEWNLDEWTDFNKTIPKGQVFTYNGTRWVAIRNYNPAVNGMPSIWTYLFYFRFA